MSEEIKFTYYLDGEKVERDSINWETNITVRVVGDKVNITTLNEGHLSTRHKARINDFI
jgi:hypothetical protein